MAELYIPGTYEPTGITAKYVADGAYVIVTLGVPGTIAGTDYYVALSRSSDGGLTWENLIDLFRIFATDDLSTLTWYDNTVAYGKKYIYTIRNSYRVADSKGNTITYQCSGPSALSNEVEVFFDDMYLVEGDKLLCIRLNPKVSSFKTTHLENKTDTLGGKYPFFFRNGSTAYKEMSISGLISYLMDVNQFFMTDEKLEIPSDFPIGGEATDLRIRSLSVDKSFAAELKFKLAVLDWLNDGKPKLFRSPAEGNYILRLMNISLSPNDTLGRMLHTFSATGYECGDPTCKAMRELGILTLLAPINLVANTLDLANNNAGIEGPATNIVFTSSQPNYKSKITYNDTETYYMYSSYYKLPDLKDDEKLTWDGFSEANKHFLSYCAIRGGASKKDPYWMKLFGSVLTLSEDEYKESSILYTYLIIAEPSTAEAKLTFTYPNGTTSDILFTDGSTRTFTDIEGNIKYEGENLKLTIIAFVAGG